MFHDVQSEGLRKQICVVYLKKKKYKFKMNESSVEKVTYSKIKVKSFIVTKIPILHCIDPWHHNDSNWIGSKIQNALKGNRRKGILKYLMNSQGSWLGFISRQSISLLIHQMEPLFKIWMLGSRATDCCHLRHYKLQPTLALWL